MYFEENYTYHIYNRSNEIVFRNKSNYLFFLKKLRIHILPYADILAYCLMPNHFHLLIQVNIEGSKLVNEDHRKTIQILSKHIGLLLSSYTQAINKQNNRKGSLFAHKTKAKKLNNFGDFKSVTQKDYSLTCFNYIHQNPLNSDLVIKLADWEFSSFIDYAGLRKGTLVNKKLAIELLNMDMTNFSKSSIKYLSEEDIKMILY